MSIQKYIVTHPSSSYGILQHFHDIFAHNSAAGEPLGPRLQDALGQADLLQGEAEREPQWESLLGNVVLWHEVG